MGIRLDDAEAWAVLADAHTGILTTLQADGWPITLPVWFVAIERTICFTTPEHTKKLSRIRRDPRASFLVESGERWAELRAVHLQGTIEIVEDDESRSDIDAAMDAKYASSRTARSAMPAATADHYTGRAYLRLVPRDRMLTWDNARIALKDGATR
jgi:PPOX class probable F420-dependent enzyme